MVIKNRDSGIKIRIPVFIFWNCLFGVENLYELRKFIKVRVSCQVSGFPLMIRLLLRKFYLMIVVL